MVKMVQVIEAIPQQISSNIKVVEGTDLIIGAIIAGVVVGLLRDAFVNKVPFYVAIAAGLLITLYGGENVIVKSIGLGLMAEGLYQLIAGYFNK